MKDGEDHTRDKDDFDGTPQSIGSPSGEAGGEAVEEEGSEAKSKESRLYRQGLSYRTMSADNTVCHNSDIGRLPAGSVIIKRFRKYAYEQVSSLVEHDYEVIRYKTADGKFTKAISLSAAILKSLTLFREHTPPVLSLLILLSTNMFWIRLFIVRCTDYPVNRCV